MSDESASHGGAREAQRVLISVQSRFTLLVRCYGKSRFTLLVRCYGKFFSQSRRPGVRVCVCLGDLARTRSPSRVHLKTIHAVALYARARAAAGW